MAVILALTGCKADYSHITGYNEIENARKLYSGLFSAHLTVTDMSTGTLTQELYYYYDEQDRLCYSYYGTDGKQEYYEYHNGSEYSYSTDNESWTTLIAGDQNYRVYSKTQKMSMCDEGMIFIKPESVTSSKSEKSGDNTVITMQYDVSQLNSSMADQLGMVGQLTGFEVIYTLDKEGYCTKLIQRGKSDNNGEEMTVDYVLEIDRMNDVAQIENPVK